MKQLGFLDFDIRLQRIDNAGDPHPLVTLNEKIDWEIFRPTIEKARKKAKKSNAGPIGLDAILMFKVLILRSLYNLSDEGLEYRILDRYSFSRFLGLHAARKIPMPAGPRRMAKISLVTRTMSRLILPIVRKRRSTG